MTITKEGALASFYTVNKAPIEHLRAYFSPKQTGEGDPSPENVREIEGWDGIEVSHTGKNLFDANNPNIISPNCWVSSNAGNKITASGVDRSLFIPCLPNTTYIISKTIGNVLSAGYTTEVPVIGMPTYSYHRDSERARQVTITTSADAKYLAIWFYDGSKTFDRTVTPETIYKTLQVEYDTASNHFEPYFGQDQTINWNATLYGGYFDLITGEIVVDWYYLHYKTKDIQDVAEQMTNCIRKRIGISNKPALVGADNSICNCLSYLDDNSDTPRYYIRGDSSLTVIHFVIPKDFNQEQDLQFAFKLSTPIIYQVSPTAIQTFIGQNNIWSNADHIEVEYDLAESNDELYYRRNIILKSVPHIETATGDIASFNTDLVAPVKSAKISFNPVQEGEGNPSPNNIRPINGWNVLNIYHHNKPLIQLPNEYQEVEYIKTPGPWNFENPQMTQAYICTQLSFNNIAKIVCKYKVLSYTQMFSPYFPMYIESYDDSSTRPTAPYATVGNQSGFVSVSPLVSSPYNGIENIYTIIPGTTDKYMRIGGWSDAYWTAEGAYYYVYVYGPNDVEIAKFIPCYRKADNIAGMYEVISNTFYPSNGSKNFIAGPECEARDILVDLSSSVGTIYGGYIDLINGELVAKWISVDMGTLSIWAGNKYNGRDLFHTVIPVKPPATNNDACNCLSPIFKSISYNAPWTIPWQMGRNPSNNRTTFMVPNNTYETAEDFRTAMEGVKLVYELAEPMTYQLTPTQLTALRGINNIWTTANGPVEIKYWTH